MLYEMYIPQESWMDPYGEWHEGQYEPVRRKDGLIARFEIEDFDDSYVWDLVFEYGYGEGDQCNKDYEEEVVFLGWWGNVVAEFRPIEED